MGLQNRKSLNFGNFGTPTWESRNKMTLGVGLMVKQKVYCNGEGGGFPQVRPMVNLVSSCLPMVHSCTKSAPTLHQPTCYLVCVGPCE
jgi:hypothetical protein